MGHSDRAPGLGASAGLPRPAGVAEAGWTGWHGRLLIGLLVTGALGGSAGGGLSAVALISRGDSPSDVAGGGGVALSADGRYLAFESTAPNLVPGQVDRGSTADVFLYDRVAGVMILVSRAAGSPVTAGNRESGAPALSADGRFVAFQSGATDLVDGQVDDNADLDLFLFDRQTGTTTLVSHAAASPASTANGRSHPPVLSADGRFVAFESEATDLVAGQLGGSGSRNVFLFDRETGTTTLVSRAADTTATAGNGESRAPALSADGRFVAFHSLATDLVTGLLDDNDAPDVFLFDRDAGTTRLVSRTAASSTTAGDGESSGPVLSADGAFVAFVSSADDLVPGQSGPGFSNVFLFDRGLGTTRLVSRTATSATTTGNDGSDAPAISADGGLVAFQSRATDLVTGQADGAASLDVFLFDRVAGTSRLVSRTALSATAAGNGEAEAPVISADGAFVIFHSRATNVVAGQVDGNGDLDVFRYDRLAATTTLVSRTAGSATTTGNGASARPRVSADGLVVAFDSLATDLVAGVADLNGLRDLFVHDAGSATTTVVSRLEPQASGDSAAGQSSVSRGGVSADGRYVVFASTAGNLVPGQVEGNVAEDVFLHDRSTGATTLVSRTAASAVTTGNAGSTSPVISADGRFVAFVSPASDLVAGQVDGHGGPDVFLFDRVAETTRLVSRAAASATIPGNGDSEAPALSADGRFVAFQSRATNLVTGQSDTNGTAADVFLYDRLSQTTTLVSRTPASATTTGNGPSRAPALSADGRFVAFESQAQDLVVGQTDANLNSDVFLYDGSNGTTKLVSRTPASATTTANGDSGAPALSADGAFVAFHSRAQNLVAGQVSGSGIFSVFLYDRVAATTSLVSRTPGSASQGGNESSTSPLLSADGAFVAFTSDATDLAPGQVDGGGQRLGPGDVFLYDRVAAATTLVSRVAGSAASAGNGSSGFPVLSADGRLVAFLSFATDLVAGQAEGNDGTDVFLFDRVTGTTTLISRGLARLASRAAAGAVTTGNGFSGGLALSADGTVLAFTSAASDLTPDDDRNGQVDVFVWNRPCAGRPAPCPGTSSRAPR